MNSNETTDNSFNSSILSFFQQDEKYKLYSRDTPILSFALARLEVFNSAFVPFALKPLALEGDSTDLRPSDIDARSLRAGGATALLCAGIDADTIQLLGRWKSDAMLRYLHIAANPVVHTYASQMFAGGHYSFRPGLLVNVLD